MIRRWIDSGFAQNVIYLNLIWNIPKELAWEEIDAISDQMRVYFADVVRVVAQNRRLNYDGEYTGSTAKVITVQQFVDNERDHVFYANK